MATGSSSVDNLDKLSQIRFITKKVFFEAYKAFTTITEDELENTLGHLLGEPPGKVYNELQKNTIKSKKAEHQDVNVLYMLLTDRNTCDLSACTQCDIQLCLQQAKKQYYKFYQETDDLLADSTVICSQLKELLMNILNEIEKKTLQSMPSLRKAIITLSDAAITSPTLNESTFILFDHILKVICLKLIGEIWKDLDGMKEFVKKTKKPFSQKEHEKIDKCTNLSELAAHILSHIVQLYLTRKTNDEIHVLNIFQDMKEIRYKLRFDSDTYSLEKCSNKFFLLATQALHYCSESPTVLPLPQNLLSELFPHLLHASIKNSPKDTEQTATITPPDSSTIHINSKLNTPTVTSVATANTGLSPSSSPMSNRKTLQQIISGENNSSSQLASTSLSVETLDSTSQSTQDHPLITAPTTHSTTNEPCFTQNEQNVLKLFQALGPKGTATKVFGKVFEAFCPNGIPDSDKPQLREELKLYEEEYKHIEDNTPPSELDLTLLGKLIRKYSKLSFKKLKIPKDTLQYHMEEVKRMRNSLMHETPTCTDSDLLNSFSVLKNRLKRILELLERQRDLQLHFQTSDIIDDMHIQLDNILHKSLPNEELKECRNRMLYMKQIWAKENVTKTHKELQEKYNKTELKLIPPIYLPLYCESREMWNVNDLYTEVEIINDLEIYNTPLTTSNIPNLLKEKTKHIILQGPTGYGKTTFCKHLVQCWNQRKNIDGLGEIDLLIFIQCRDVCKDSKTLLTNLKEDLLPKSLATLSFDDIVTCLKESRLLFLFDGFDEAGPSAQTLVRDSLIKFPECAVIITTRPEFMLEASELIRSTTNTSDFISLSMLGFSENSRCDYTDKLFKGNYNYDPKPFLTYLKSMDNSLGSFAKSPIALAMLFFLWTESKNIFEASTPTNTKIYQRLCELLIKRDVRRHISDNYHDHKDIQRKIRKWTKSLAKIAWQAIQEKRSYLLEEEENTLRDNADDLFLKSGNALSILMKCGVRLNTHMDYETWEFTHKSIQEFLAAEHICQDILNGKSFEEVFHFPFDLDKKHSKVKEFIQIITFVVGILSQNESFVEKVDKVFQLLNFQASWTFNEIKNIYVECPKSKEIEMSLRYLFAGETLSEDLEGYDLNSLNFILKKTSLGVPATTKIRFSNANEIHLRELLDTLISRQCLPKVVAPVRDAKSIENLTSVLNSLTQSSKATIIFQMQLADHLPYLVDNWQWERPLHLKFPYILFPLIWFHLISYLAEKNIQISSITYTGDEELANIVDQGANWLSIRFITDGEEHSDDEIVITK